MSEQIVLYESQDGETQVNVLLQGETVWLTQSQMVELFASSKANISEHIKHIFDEGELKEESVVRKFRTTAADGKTYSTKHYNLDVIISVGYRVKSLRGTQFRIWATNVLKHHLVDGYTRNQHRLNQLDYAIKILSRSSNDMVSGITGVLECFSGGLDLLDNYDHQTLKKGTGRASKWVLTYKEARVFIDAMSYGENSDLFGVERDDSLKGIVAGLYQSFNEVDLYPSIQEKAANLLYLIVKDHSFTDGNKRIAAALFVYFLEKNDALRDAGGKQIIDNNALAAITLMVAFSNPEEKEIMCTLIMNMLCTHEN